MYHNRHISSPLKIESNLTENLFYKGLSDLFLPRLTAAGMLWIDAVFLLKLSASSLHH